MDNEDLIMSSSSEEEEVQTPISSPNKTILQTPSQSQSQPIFSSSSSSSAIHTPTHNLRSNPDTISLTPVTPHINTSTSSSSQDDQVVLNSFIGTLESMYRTANRQKKWPLIILLPNQDTFISSNPHLNNSISRPAWGPGSYHYQQQQKFKVSKKVDDNILLWRRTPPSSDADRYTAFFPVDGLPHIALLDPRSGERLCVWGNRDGQGMQSYNIISDQLWNQIISDLNHFLNNHNLNDSYHLGPLHYQQKSWAVKTRRISSNTNTNNNNNNNLPSTSIMDDEQAAIDAAIAASLADVDSQKINDHDQQQQQQDNESNNDQNSDEIYSEDDITTEQNSSIEKDDDQQNQSISSPTIEKIPIQTTTTSSSSLPIRIPNNVTSTVGPSSIESLSSSYLERMDSCFRSSIDPQLMEVRRLRKEQDEELAASLEEDRRKDKLEKIQLANLQQKEKFQQDAQQRLPNEPLETSQNCITIGIRLENGNRIIRRFLSNHLLNNVADFIIASTGFYDLTSKSPDCVLRTPGGSIKTNDWNVSLQDLKLGRRIMFILDHKSI